MMDKVGYLQKKYMTSQQKKEFKKKRDIKEAIHRDKDGRIVSKDEYLKTDKERVDEVNQKNL